jgi:cytochrome bd-type quinol oxidase subunit 2
MFFPTIKAIHLLALVLGAGASLGNIYLMLARGPADLPAPALTNALRKWYRLTALVAIVTLWLTGLLLVLTGDAYVENTAFTYKIAFALALLAIIVFLNIMAPMWARRGGPPTWVSSLHITGTLCLLASVAMAAYAFG